MGQLGHAHCSILWRVSRGVYGDYHSVVSIAHAECDDRRLLLQGKAWPPVGCWDYMMTSTRRQRRRSRA